MSSWFQGLQGILDKKSLEKTSHTISILNLRSGIHPRDSSKGWLPSTTNITKMSFSVENLANEDTLTLKLKIQTNKTETISSDNGYTISHTRFYFKVQVLEMNNTVWHSVYFMFKPSSPVFRRKDLTEETIRVTSKALFMKNRTFKNNSTCAQVYNSRRELNEIDIKIQVIKPTLNKFYVLYDDVDMTDFELCVDDGCVRFHRFALAISSPALKTMLSGKWKKTVQGHVEVPGISKNTIQQFKDFIYKSVVPENVSLELLSFASYYMMTELEEICLEKIADSLTSENTWSLLEYCVSHKLTKLLPVILNRLKDVLYEIDFDKALHSDSKLKG